MVAVPRGRRRPRALTSQDLQGQPDPADYMMALAASRQNRPVPSPMDLAPAQAALAKRAPPQMQEAPEVATPEQNIGVIGGSR
jgi:hypothetical protein